MWSILLEGLSMPIGEQRKIASKQQEMHRGQYDKRCWGAEPEVAALILVRQTAWKGRHEIQGR